MRIVVLASGGLDSTTLAYQAAFEGYDQIDLLGFDYGQTNLRELASLKAIASALTCNVDYLNISDVGRNLSSELTDRTRTVAKAGFSNEQLSGTAVPNRNAIFLNIGWAIAKSRGALAVGFAGYKDPVYHHTDATPEFVKKMEAALQEGCPDPSLRIFAPFIRSTKADIVKAGHALDVPFHLTWSCYHSGDKHCGVCWACCDRREAFYQAKISDPTDYEDNEHWKTVVQL